MVDFLQGSIDWILTKYQHRIAKCIEGGFYEFIEEYKEKRAYLRPTTITNIVIDLIRKWVKAEFEHDSNVSIIELKNKPLIIQIEAGGQRVMIWFKKLDSQGHARWIKTNQKDRFTSQQKLELYKPAINLFTGYNPDKLFTRIEDILLSCPIDESRNLWKIDITPSREKSKIDLPLVASEATATGNTIPRVRIKDKKHILKEGTTGN